MCDHDRPSRKSYGPKPRGSPAYPITLTGVRAASVEDVAKTR
jgi:hypothetical protein